MRHFKFAVVFLVFSMISVSGWADFKPTKDRDFSLDQTVLGRGDVQMYMSLTDPSKLAGSRFQLLDRKGDVGQDSDAVVMSRFAFIVDKDIGFFKTQEAISPKRTAALLPEGADLTSIGRNTYRVRLPHPNPFATDVRAQLHLEHLASAAEIDANRLAGEIVRRMPDGRSKPSAMTVQEMSDFNKYFKSGTTLSRFYSAGCGKTLITADSLMVLRRGGVKAIESDAMGLMTAEDALGKQARDQVNRVIEALERLR